MQLKYFSLLKQIVTVPLQVGENAIGPSDETIYSRSRHSRCGTLKNLKISPSSVIVLSAGVMNSKEEE